MYKFRPAHPSLWLGLVLLSVFSLFLPALGVAEAQAATPVRPDTYQSYFTAAANEFGVPEALLLAISYNETRWEQHGGQPSFSGGYGLMHLTQVTTTSNQSGKKDNPAQVQISDPRLHTLDQAAQLLGLNPEVLKKDPRQNIRGAAALLAQDALATVGNKPGNEADWYGALAKYSGAKTQATAFDFADSVYATVAVGASRTTSEGQFLNLPAKKVVPNRATADRLGLPRSLTPATTPAPDCPTGLDCEFIPAAYQQNSSDPTDYGNYDLANRPADGLNVRYIVIHDTESSYNAALSTFESSLSYVSAHYVVRSSDGHIAQMVENKNVAFHAGNWYVNTHAIGVEHEGVAIEGATWYNETLYRKSAQLVRYLALKYNVPLDRAHIIGHDDIPGPTASTQAGMHWDPGPFWDWDHYMVLVGAPIVPRPIFQGATRNVITIKPQFSTNKPALTYCYVNEQSDCRDVPSQGANFVYLYTAPSFSAPLITNPYISDVDTRANNWANKAVTGQQFYRADHQGDWDAIYFSGQKAWFYNPCRYGLPIHSQALATPITPSALKYPCITGLNSVMSQGNLIRPKATLSTIDVYGRAYPEATAYPGTITPQSLVPIYSIPAGQIYVATDLVKGDYYYAHTFATDLANSDHVVVQGQTQYYQIFFNHRLGFVKASDVDLVN